MCTLYSIGTEWTNISCTVYCTVHAADNTLMVSSLLAVIN